MNGIGFENWMDAGVELKLELKLELKMELKVKLVSLKMFKMKHE